jgi:hypothetical protein
MVVFYTFFQYVVVLSNNKALLQRAENSSRAWRSNYKLASGILGRYAGQGATVSDIPSYRTHERKRVGPDDVCNQPEMIQKRVDSNW